MCSKTASHVKMWSREGVPSAVSARLPLMGHFSAQHAVSFSTLCTSTEGFQLKHASFSAYLSVATGFCILPLFFFFTSLMRG